MMVLANSLQQILPFTALAYFKIYFVYSSFRGSPNALIIFFRSDSVMQPFQSEFKLELPSSKKAKALSNSSSWLISDCFEAKSRPTSTNFFIVKVPSLFGSTAFFKAQMSCSLGKSLADRINFAKQQQMKPISEVGILLFLFSSYTLQISSSFSKLTLIINCQQLQITFYPDHCIQFSQDLDIVKPIMRLNMKSILICFLVSLAFARNFPGVEVTKVEKVVQLMGPYPTQIDKIDHKCLVEDCGQALYFALTEQEFQRVSNIAFAKDKQLGDALKYTTQQYSQNGENFILFAVSLKRRFHQGQNIVLAVTITYLNRYINYPSSIDLSEDQKFEYEDNRRYLSPYVVKDAITTYKFTKIIGFGEDGEKKGLSSVAFRSSDVEPFTYVKHRVHGVNNGPQVYFSEVVREIEVSHWGNIAITEFYKIKNIGPELKGEFSRVQFSSNNKFEAKNAWRGIQTDLPYEIWGLYYRDEVGNISTSKAYRDDRNAVVKLGLAPRYALLGGWKANWELGYNLNTEGFLTHDGNKYELNKIPIQFALSSILTEKYTIRIILPEGSQNVNLFIGGEPVDTKKISNGVSFGYLDFSGRPTFTIDNLKGSFKDQKLRISYNYEYILLFKKPLLVFGAIFSILVLMIVVKRLNMSAFEESHVKKSN